MPTYEYACTSCGEHLEVVQSFRDDPLSACPACHGPLRKVFGSIGVVFKGSGFYKTDSRSASSSSKSAASSSTKSKEVPSTAKSSEGSAGSSGAASDGSNGNGPSKSSSSSGAAAAS
ncbi:MAG: FmdB family zinc ribbon protein [Acidimicrobiales bacterium]